MCSMLSSALAIVLSVTATSVLAQDYNPAFISSCGPNDWALTYDDGPSTNTPDLLGTLDEFKVKATFFVLGKVLADEGLRVHTKAAYDAGHMIASHSFSHANFTELSYNQMDEQMSQANAEIKKTIGFETNYFRPPYGECKKACADYMDQNGYTVVQWNMDSNDWKEVDKTAEEQENAFRAFEDTIKKSSPSTGYISLQHDIHKFSVAMVPRIIKLISEAGYNFVTVDKCTPNSPPPYRGATPTPTSTATKQTTSPTKQANDQVATTSNAGESSTLISLLIGSTLFAAFAAF